MVMMMMMMMMVTMFATIMGLIIMNNITLHIPQEYTRLHLP